MNTNLTQPTGRQKKTKRFIPILMALLLLMVANMVQAGGNSITTPDSIGDVGWYTSMQLDSNGYPVVAYEDRTNGDLKLMHCNDVNCAGGDESITAVDTNGPLNTYISMVLDGNGNPVIAYQNGTSPFSLNLMHCNDPNCTGNDESVTNPDPVNFYSVTTALALDTSGNPVIVHMGGFPGQLRVVHCNDPDCAGGDESVTTPYTFTDSAGNYNAMALDSNGNPIVAFHDFGANNSDQHLKVMRCNDVDCAGNDETITVVDPDQSWFISMTLDSNDYPVIVYQANGLINVTHCNDTACVGGDESVNEWCCGFTPSVVLDDNGFPVISYASLSNPANLIVVHCNDADCAGGDDVPNNIDNSSDTGLFPSNALDSNGLPVISYFDRGNGDLKLLHCATSDCAPPPPADAIDDAYDTDEDTVLNVAAPGVLGNDLGGSLTATLMTPPASGNVLLNADGSFEYTPAADFNGTVTFTYEITDGGGAMDTATVQIDVNPVNDAPVAVDDSYQVNMNGRLRIPDPGVLLNDTDVDGDMLRTKLISAPAVGQLRFGRQGSVDYKPPAGFTGQVTFQYRITDRMANSQVATVTIDVVIPLVGEGLSCGQPLCESAEITPHGSFWLSIQDPASTQKSKTDK